MIITLLRSEMPSPEQTAEDLLLRDTLSCMGGEIEHVCWDDATYDWSRTGFVLIRDAPRQAEQRQAFLSWAAAVSQTTPLWTPVPLMHQHLCEEKQPDGWALASDSTSTRRSLIILDDLFVYAVERPAMLHAEEEVMTVVATREERAIAFAALQQLLLGESCRLSRVDVRQSPGEAVVLEAINLIDSHLSLAISPLAAYSLAQGCLRLFQQAQRSKEDLHAVSLARQKRLASRYLLPQRSQRGLKRGRSIAVSFSKEEKRQ